MRMVYKINNLNDLENIKDIDDEAKAILTYYTEAMVQSQDEEKLIDNVGGYILYCPKNTKAKEIKNYLDISCRRFEYLEVIASLCVIHYLIDNDTVITLVLYGDDIPEEILIDIQGEKI